METIGPFAYLLKSANFVTFILLNKHSQSINNFTYTTQKLLCLKNVNDMPGVILMQ